MSVIKKSPNWNVFGGDGHVTARNSFVSMMYCARLHFKYIKC